MKLTQLIAELTAAEARLNMTVDPEVEIWLPGSRIYLTGVMRVAGKDGALLVEGNLRPGSALDDTASPSERRTFREST